jgi:anti-sigma B factor antagonist
MMKITVKEYGDVAVLEMDGRMSLGEASAYFRESVRNLLRDGTRKFVLDYSHVTYQDSSGNGELVAAFTVTRNAGGDLVLVGLNQKLVDLFKVTKLFAVFNIFGSVSEALAHFGVSGESDEVKKQ